MNSLNQNSIIVISWDGITKPLDHILFDAIPDFIKSGIASNKI